MLFFLSIFNLTLFYQPTLSLFDNFDLTSFLPNTFYDSYNKMKCKVSTYCDPCEPPTNLPKSLDITNRYKVKTEIYINRERTLTTFRIKGKGLPKTLNTLWLVFDKKDSLNEIFKYALTTVPVASTTDAFTNGRSPKNEPNYINTNENGDFTFQKTINFNIFRKLQTPLVAKNVRLQDKLPNKIEDRTTGFIYKNVNQRKYKGLNGESIGFSGVSSEYLREFDENGVEVIDANGNVIIPRANLLPRFLIIASHIDNKTHGIHPGFADISAGDHWDVTIYDLYTVDPICLGD